MKYAVSKWWNHNSNPCSAACMLSHVSRVLLFATVWTVAHQAPPTGMGCHSMGCHGIPSPRDLPDPEIKPVSLLSPALASGFLATSTTWKARISIYILAKFPELFAVAGCSLTPHPSSPGCSRAQSLLGSQARRLPLRRCHLLPGRSVSLPVEGGAQGLASPCASPEA